VTRLQDTVGSEATARDRRRLTATVVLGPTDLGSVVEAVSTAPAAAAATVLACSTRSHLRQWVSESQIGGSRAGSTAS
jgi:hypothetical protein